MSPLPRFVIIKSKFNGKYLKSISNKEGNSDNGLPPTFVKFEGDDVTNPLVKFEVERAMENSEYVHIRCCHTNKYLTIHEKEYTYAEATAQQSGERSCTEHNNTNVTLKSLRLFVAGADQPKEDLSLPLSCTMFKPIKANNEFGSTTSDELYFRFQHVGTEHYARLGMAKENRYENGLIEGSTSTDDAQYYDVFKVLDWESLVIFPKTSTVAFMKCIQNKDMYLSSYWSNGLYLSVLMNAGITDVTVAHEIFTVGDGYVRIKNVSTGKFWRRQNDEMNYIMPDSDDTTSNDPNTLFFPIKVDDNVVVLRNLGNNYFCTTDSLRADTPDMTDGAKFKVVERVTSREIYNITFHHNEGRVYNVEVIEKDQVAAENPDDFENTMSKTFKYSKTKSTTVGKSVSLMLGVKTTIRVTAIPLIIRGKIELSAELTGTYQWGETNTVETSSESTYTVKVPPKTRTVVTLVATQGMCEVPFSYVQKDRFHDGTSKITDMKDGVYKGINTFNVEFKTHHEKLP